MACDNGDWSKHTLHVKVPDASFFFSFPLLSPLLDGEEDDANVSKNLVASSN